MLALQPAKAVVLELGEYLSPARPIRVPVDTFSVSYHPSNVYPLLVGAVGKNFSPEVVLLAWVEVVDPPFESYETSL